MTTGSGIRRSLSNRRSFLRQASCATALTALSYSRVLGANERVGIGVIGYGLIAKTHVATFRKLPEADITAIAYVTRSARKKPCPPPEAARHRMPTFESCSTINQWMPSSSRLRIIGMP